MIMKIRVSRLKIFRVAAGLSQIDLAKKTGLSQPYISLIETKRAIPTAGIREKLADAVGADDSKGLFEEN